MAERTVERKLEGRSKAGRSRPRWPKDAKE
jgi:hypothetical protein